MHERNTMTIVNKGLSAKLCNYIRITVGFKKCETKPMHPGELANKGRYLH